MLHISAVRFFMKFLILQNDQSYFLYNISFYALIACSFSKFCPFDCMYVYRGTCLLFQAPSSSSLIVFDQTGIEYHNSNHIMHFIFLLFPGKGKFLFLLALFFLWGGGMQHSVHCVFVCRSPNQLNSINVIMNIFMKELFYKLTCI